MNTLSIVIVNFNTAAQTVRCLDSVAAELVRLRDVGIVAETVVVDNGSTDDSVPAIASAHPDVRLVEAGENLGFARGVNLGARVSGGDWILLLNPDTIVLPDSLVHMLTYALAHPEAAIMGGRTIDEDGNLVPSSCWGAPTLWSLACFATGLSTLARGSAVWDPESLGPWRRDTVRHVPIVTGCLLLCSRTTWEHLDGMDEAYFLYGEDADFSLRAERAGLARVIVPEAVIVHTVGGSTEAHNHSNGRKMAMVFAGRVSVLDRLWPRSRAVVGRSLLLAGCGLRAVGERIRGRAGTWSDVWRTRDDWSAGYPLAYERLFASQTSRVHT